MPRSRSIRRAKPKKNNSFLPLAMQEFFARRLFDVFALSFVFAGAFLILALTTYHSADPSWNSANTLENGEKISNWVGLGGAYAADIMAQSIGAAGFLIGLIVMIWGIRFYKRQPITWFWSRWITLALAAFLTAIAIAPLSSQSWLVHDSMGSTIGATSFNHITDVLSFSWIKPWMIATAFGTLAFALTLHAASVRKHEIAFAFQSVLKLVFGTFAVLANIILSFRNWVLRFNDPGYEPSPLIETNIKLPKLTMPKIKVKIDPPLTSTEGKAEKPALKSAPAVEKEVPPQTTGTSATTKKEPSDFLKARMNIPVVTPQKASDSGPSSNTGQSRFPLTEGEWEAPPLSLIQAPPPNEETGQLDEAALQKNAEMLQNVLSDFNVEGEIVSIHPGPVVTLYELEPAPGTKTSRVISISDDIARSMAAVSVRCAVIPGRNVIGIELPNKSRQTVYMQELLNSRLFEKTAAKLPLILGKDISGQPILADLSKMPHLLVAGTTGSGKSVAVNTMIMSLLFRLPPEKCRFIMIDPKMLELSIYDEIPHLLSPVVTEPGQAVVALKWTVNEMEERYRAMSKLGVRNIEGYNKRLEEARKNDEKIMQKVQTGFDPETGQPEYEEQEMDLTELPYIVVVVDEFADLMLVAGKDVENAIQRLAQMARAAGIHLIMATQRPSVDVITGVIKANFPTRISFQVTSKIDSRTILGEGGAEQLLGMGDMLYMAPGGRITRVHGPFVSDKDVEQVTNFLRKQGKPAYVDGITSGDGDFGGSEIMGALFGDGDSGDDKVDELYDQAVAIVAREGKASTSFIQRHLQIGYNRAARIIEEMERQGIISKASPTGKREILVRDFSDV